MITLLLLACGARTPAPLYPLPLASPPEPPPRAVYQAPADACPTEASYVPSRPAPWIDEQGHPTCRAHVVPSAQVIDLVQDADDADHWHDLALSCHSYRAIDRAYAEQVVGSCRADRRATELELSVQRTIVPVALVGGVLFGVGVGLAAAHVAP